MMPVEPEVGKTYEVNHMTRGVFCMRVDEVGDGIVSGVVTDGFADETPSDRERFPGDHIRIGQKSGQFYLVEESPSWGLWQWMQVAIASVILMAAIALLFRHDPSQADETSHGGTALVEVEPLTGFESQANAKLCQQWTNAAAMEIHRRYPIPSGASYVPTINSVKSNKEGTVGRVEGSAELVLIESWFLRPHISFSGTWKRTETGWSLLDWEDSHE